MCGVQGQIPLRGGPQILASSTNRARMQRARWLLRRGSEAGEVAEGAADPVLECEACRFCLRPQATEPDHVRIRKALADHKVAPRLQDAPEFLERTALLWDLSECGNQVGGI